MYRKLISSHYGQSGHEKEKCYQLISFLESWGKRGQGSVASSITRGGSQGGVVNRRRRRNYVATRVNIAQGDVKHYVVVSRGFSDEQLKLLQTMFKTWKSVQQTH